MPTQTQALETRKFRKYTSSAGEFYLATGMVTENADPKVRVRRWDADKVLRDIKTQYSNPKGFPEYSIQLPTLYQSHTAAKQDSEMHDSIFSGPAEWQSHLILNPDAPPETDEYVIKDLNRNGSTLETSSKPRLINPIEINKDNKKHIVTANVFPLFDLEHGKYDPEDLDPENGFLKKLNPNGQYRIWFGKDNRLYAMLLDWDGVASCDWSPGGSSDIVGLRGCSTGNLPTELLESEADVLKASHARETQKLREESERVKTHYESGLRELRERINFLLET